MHGEYGIWAVAIIVVCYLAFAAQLLIQISWHHKFRDGARALLALVAVFILCATTGYLSDFFPPHLAPVRDGLHWALAAASLWLVFSNAGGAVARLLSD